MEQRTYFFFNNACYEPGTLRQRAYGNNRITSKELPFFLSLALFSLFRSRKKKLFSFGETAKGGRGVLTYFDRRYVGKLHLRLVLT